jgi:hypothetical protein
VVLGNRPDALLVREGGRIIASAMEQQNRRSACLPSHQAVDTKLPYFDPSISDVHYV